MATLFKKTTPKIEVEKVKISVSIDKTKIEKYEQLKSQMESQKFQVLGISQALEIQIDRIIKKLESALLPSKSTSAKIDETTNNSNVTNF